MVAAPPFEVSAAGEVEKLHHLRALQLEDLPLGDALLCLAAQPSLKCLILLEKSSLSPVLSRAGACACGGQEPQSSLLVHAVKCALSGLVTGLDPESLALLSAHPLLSPSPSQQAVAAAQAFPPPASASGGFFSLARFTVGGTFGSTLPSTSTAETRAAAFGEPVTQTAGEKGPGAASEEQPPPSLISRTAAELSAAASRLLGPSLYASTEAHDEQTMCCSPLSVSHPKASSAEISDVLDGLSKDTESSDAAPVTSAAPAPIASSLAAALQEAAREAVTALDLDETPEPTADEADEEPSPNGGWRYDCDVLVPAPQQSVLVPPAAPPPVLVPPAAPPLPALLSSAARYAQLTRGPHATPRPTLPASLPSPHRGASTPTAPPTSLRMRAEALRALRSGATAFATPGRAANRGDAAEPLEGGLPAWRQAYQSTPPPARPLSARESVSQPTLLDGPLQPSVPALPAWRQAYAAAPPPLRPLASRVSSSGEPSSARVRPDQPRL